MSQTELILNSDGSVYHLNLLPGDLAKTIILVGDPGRVQMVSRYFDEITVQKSKREFITHTGRLGGKELSVISTGIGTDNVDIVMNETDALFNVDFESRQPKDNITQLTFMRLGTSGALQRDIPLDSIVLARYALGLDALARLGISHTDDLSRHWFEALDAYTASLNIQLQPAYMTLPDEQYVQLFSDVGAHWITLTCAGFYGLQGRSVRLESNMAPLLRELREFDAAGLRVGNLEMETAGMYLLARLMGHRAISLNAIIANRFSGMFSADPKKAVDNLIRQALMCLVPG